MVRPAVKFPTYNYPRPDERASMHERLIKCAAEEEEEEEDRHTHTADAAHVSPMYNGWQRARTPALRDARRRAHSPLIRLFVASTGVRDRKRERHIGIVNTRTPHGNCARHTLVFFFCNALRIGSFSFVIGFLIMWFCCLMWLPRRWICSFNSNAIWVFLLV